MRENWLDGTTAKRAASANLARFVYQVFERATLKGNGGASSDSRNQYGAPRRQRPELTIGDGSPFADRYQAIILVGHNFGALAQ